MVGFLQKRERERESSGENTHAGLSFLLCWFEFPNSNQINNGASNSNQYPGYILVGTNRCLSSQNSRDFFILSHRLKASKKGGETDSTQL